LIWRSAFRVLRSARLARLAGLVLVLVGCQAPPPAVITPIPSTPRTFATPTEQRAVSVAVAAASPTATAALVGDYPSLVRPRVERVEQGLGRIDQQLAIVQQSPVRMAAEDWRNQTQGVLEDLAAAASDLRALGARGGSEAALYAEVFKLLTDLDFVVSEYRMALDFDPDGSHFIRAGRAAKTTGDEVESILLGLRRPIGPALTPTPAR
jgi:hypothetical protein